MTGPLERIIGLATSSDAYQDTHGESTVEQTSKSNRVLPTVDQKASLEETSLDGNAITDVNYASGFGSVKLHTGLRRNDVLRIDVGAPNAPPNASSSCKSPLTLSPLVAVDIHSSVRQQGKLSAETRPLGTSVGSITGSDRSWNSILAQTQHGHAFMAEVKSGSVQAEQKPAITFPVPVAIKTGTREESDSDCATRGKKSQ